MGVLPSGGRGCVKFASYSADSKTDAKAKTNDIDVAVIGVKGVETPSGIVKRELQLSL